MFNKIASASATYMGKSWAFISACLIVIIWAVTGPMFAYSDTWQLVINTGTTVVTFLMIFLVQNSQNRDGLAMQVKLDAIIHALEDVDNKFERLEEQDEETIREIRDQA